MKGNTNQRTMNIEIENCEEGRSSTAIEVKKRSDTILAVSLTSLKIKIKKVMLNSTNHLLLR